MRYDGIAMGKRATTEGAPTSITVGTDRGPVQVQVAENGDVQVTQGGMVTVLPYARPV